MARKKPQGRQKAFDELSRLAAKNPSGDDFKDYIREISSKENDRGAAILFATNVENALQVAIERRLTVENHKRLFGFDSPIGTFEGKIRIGRALEIFGSSTEHNLYCIKQVRNAFAHAKVAISFKSGEVRNVCQLLQFVPPSEPAGLAAYGNTAGRFNALSERARFESACNTASHNLFSYARDALQIFPWFKVPTSPEADKYQILVRPKPLP